MPIDSIGITNFLKEFEPLVYKTMQRLNISQRSADFDDFFQELQVKLLEILEKFQSDTADLEEKKYKFVHYAGNGLYWHGISIIRKQSHQISGDIDYHSMDWQNHEELSEPNSMEISLETEEFFELAKGRLSEKEYSFMLKLTEENHTMQELADGYSVSRATIYQWKEKIQTRLQDIKDCLID